MTFCELGVPAGGIPWAEREIDREREERESIHSVESDPTTAELDLPSKVSCWSFGRCRTESQLSVTPTAAGLFGRQKEE